MENGVIRNLLYKQYTVEFLRRNFGEFPPNCKEEIP